MFKKIKQIIKLYRKGNRKEAVKELRMGYIKWEKRCQRGEQLLAIVVHPIEQSFLKGGMIMLVIEKFADKFDWSLPAWFWLLFFPLTYTLQKITEYKAGRYDQKTLHLWEEENDWIAKNVSKWEQEKMRLLKKLDK